MKKAYIYFKGKEILFVLFEKIEHTEYGTFLTKGYGDDKKTVAKIPLDHLIIIE